MPLISVHVTSKRSGLDALEGLTTARARSVSTLFTSRFPGSEIVTLRTCNRFEIYLSVPDDEMGEVTRWVAKTRYAPRQFNLSGSATVSHLFSVAAGLDSELVGEEEVLGQVRNAYLEARERGEARSELGFLFDMAIFTGRRVRQETGISSGMRSLSRLAIEEAKKVLPDLTSREIGILGSGEMGEKVLSRLVAERATRVTLASRLDKRRHELAGKWGVPIVPPADLLKNLSMLDVLFCASDSEKPVATLSGKKLRRTSPLVVVDLGMPRNIRVDSPGKMVHLIDLKKLQRLSRQISKRKSDVVPAANDIVQEEASRYAHHAEERDVAVFADRLLSRAYTIAADESARAVAHFHCEEPHEKILENFGRAIVKRLLLPSLARLKSLPESERVEILRSAEYLLADGDAEGDGSPASGALPGESDAPSGKGSSGGRLSDSNSPESSRSNGDLVHGQLVTSRSRIIAARRSQVHSSDEAAKT